MQRTRRNSESGFAMMLVFLMAAVIAISLYVEIPRIAFDAQRQKEQLLIARGEQYKRAIEVFYKANKRYPATIEELDNMNNRHYLRHHYRDPITGKDEWRVIHTNGRMLTDSLVTPNPMQGTGTGQPGQPGVPGAPGAPGGTGAAASGFGAGANTGGSGFQWGNSGIAPAQVSGAQGVVNLGNRKRASDDRAPGVGDGGGTGAPADPNQPPADPNNPNPNNPNANNPNAPGTAAGQQPGTVNGQPGVGLPPGVPVMPGGLPGRVPTDPTTQAPINPSQYPNQSQFPGQPVNSQTGGVSGQPYPTMPGANGVAPGYAQPGNIINNQLQGPNQAQQMIQQILTSPRPGGMPGATGPQIGGGIAGFASNADADGIMVYNDRTNYKEWEFVFDFSKLRNPPNPLSGGIGTPASQMGNTGGQPIGTPAANMPGATSPGFGNTSGFGNPGGFGMGPSTTPIRR